MHYIGPHTIRTVYLGHEVNPPWMWVEVEWAWTEGQSYESVHAGVCLWAWPPWEWAELSLEWVWLGWSCVLGEIPVRSHSMGLLSPLTGSVELKIDIHHVACVKWNPSEPDNIGTD